MTVDRRTSVKLAGAVHTHADRVIEKVIGANLARPFQEVWT